MTGSRYRCAQDDRLSGVLLHAPAMTVLRETRIVMLFWTYQLITAGMALLVSIAIWREKSPARQLTGGMVLVLLLLRLLLVK
jgi:hypothetical protein